MSAIYKTLKNSGCTKIGYKCNNCGRQYISLYDLKDPDFYGWLVIESKIDSEHYCQNCKEGIDK